MGLIRCPPNFFCNEPNVQLGFGAVELYGSVAIRGDFSLFCLDSMRSTISAKSSQLCGDKVSLSGHPWMSSYIMQCVSWLWTVFWRSSDYFPGELKWRWARYSILQVWSARNSNTSWFIQCADGTCRCARLVFLLGIFRRTPRPSVTRGHPCALLLPRGRPAP
jgi:hypothetical protein